MSKKYFSLCFIMGTTLMVFFQNCGQVQHGLAVNDTLTSVSDESGNLVDIIQPQPQADVPEQVEEDGGVVSVDPIYVAPAEDTVTQVEEEVAVEPVKEVVKEIVEDKTKEVEAVVVKDKKSCGHAPEKKDIKYSQDANDCLSLAKQFPAVIDIDKYKSSYKIDVARGKTLIYSSSGNGSLAKINIENMNGKTVLCNVTIDQVTFKVGRLDLVNSKINQLINQKGIVNQDSSSYINGMNK